MCGADEERVRSVCGAGAEWDVCGAGAEWDVCGAGAEWDVCGACAEWDVCGAGAERSAKRPQLRSLHYYLSFSNGLKPHIFICYYLYMCSSDSMYTCTC